MINALAEVRGTTFPALHPRFAFASLLLRNDLESQGPLAFRFMRFNEQEGVDEVIVEFTVPDENHPSRMQFYQNFPFGVRIFSQGEIRFRLLAKEGDGEWYEIATQKLNVAKVDVPKDESTEGTPTLEMP